MAESRLLTGATAALSRRWPLCFGFVFATCSLLDRLAGGEPDVSLLWAFAAGAGSGLAYGAISGGIAKSLRNQRWYWVIAPWLGVGLLIAWSLALDLGIFSRLQGQYRFLAWIGLVGCTGLAILGAGLAALLAPQRGYPSGWLLAHRTSWKLAVTIALASAAAVMAMIDRRFQPLGYPFAHDALRGATVICLTATLWLVTEPKLQERVCRWGNLALLLGFAPLFSLTPKRLDQAAALERRPFSAFALHQARLLSDVDFDGQSSVFGGADCGPFDHAVNPRAPEIPGNGIDDNCRLGDAPKKLVDNAAVPVPTEPTTTNVVLITIDSLSALRMHLFGATRQTTPQLDAWAAHAVVFDRAYTAGGWTSLAMSALFRGTYPRRLEWTRVLETNLTNLLRVNEPVPKGETARRSFGLPLDEQRAPLAWWLQRRGMHTAAVANDRQSEFLDPRFVGKGFDEFVDLDYGGRGKASDSDVTKAALNVLAHLPSDKPNFLWIHYFGPHLPYEVHKNSSDFGSSTADHYDNEILYNDTQVARFLTALDATSWGPKATVFIAADHGERVQGEWRGHGMDVHEGTLRIPLIMRSPGFAPQRVQTPVSSVDVMPTILGMTGTPAPVTDGVDLRDVIGGKDPKRALFADTWRFNAKGDVIKDETAVFDGQNKIEFDHGSQTSTAFGQRPERRLKRLPDNSAYEHLRAALNQYLEENGALVIHD